MIVVLTNIFEKKFAILEDFCWFWRFYPILAIIETYSKNRSFFYRSKFPLGTTSLHHFFISVKNYYFLANEETIVYDDEIHAVHKNSI